MKSYVIHLIRHGVSVGNEEGRYVGSTDSPLSENGKKALKELKKTGAYPNAQAYYTSPLSRCRETLALLYPDARPEVIEDFRESDFGKWENKTIRELSQTDPVYQAWMKGGQNTFPPEGENGAVFMHRVCQAFEELVTGLMKSGTTEAVVVTHGGVIMTILTAYGLPRAKFYDWMTDFGCGYSLRITPGLWMRGMVAEVFARIPALAEDPMEEARGAADLLWGEEDKE